jgi:DNA polymerase I-like protein with 3'-5' exonuclease and polymerase domains
MSKFVRIAAPFIVPAGSKSDGLRLAFDIEADALLDAATKAHCVAVADLDSDQIDEYGPEQIPAALEHLARADYLTGHNICGYDLPLLHKLYNWGPASGCAIVDTLVTSRLILPHLDDLDAQATAMGDPALGKSRGRHSLEAWGVRLGIAKIGAGIEDFAEWSPEVQERCVGDATICKALWQFLQPDGYSQQALALEHRTAPICNCITVDGVPFDREAAEPLRQRWEARLTELEARLERQLPGTNPSSRLQIGRLLEARGWVPERRTEKTGQAVIDDELLESLPAIYPEFAGLAEHNLLRRRLAQLAHGKEAWLKHVGPDGRIHGGLVPIGTPHSRAKHLSPNLAQVPNAKKGAAYAAECRALFRAPTGWTFVTCDQANLQDRAFAHHLAEFDRGAYARAFLNGVDQHWESAIALGLVPAGTERDKGSKLHTAIRESAKRFRYGFLFGAGNKKAGRIVYDSVRAVDQINATFALQQKFFGSASHPGEGILTEVGRQARDRFMTATPGLQHLRASLEAQVTRRGWLLGLDGRRVPTRAQYTALNYAVTSAEAIICKRWLVQVFSELCARFRYGWSGDAVITLWIHDEIAVCCRTEIAEQVGEILVRHAREPGEFYGFKVPLDADYKIGSSWAGEPIEPTAKLVPAGTDSSPDANAAPEASSGDGKVNGVDVHVALAEEPIAFRTTPLLLVDLIGQPLTNGKVHCPFHDDDTPSCHIYPDHYHCFSCRAHGNAIDWLRDVEGMDYEAAVELLASWSGQVAQSRASTDARSLALALRLWEAAQPLAGTPAITYLRDIRGIDIEALPPKLDQVLRFHPSCPFGPGMSRPCLLALFRDVESDAPAGIHRIALTPETLAGRRVERRMLGRWPTARAIKLWSAAPRLFLGEGIETTLAAASRMRFRGEPMRPAWAAGSSGNIAKLPLVPGVEQLVLLTDHDTAGETAARTCQRIWCETGRDVVRLRPIDRGADFNDLVLEKLRVAS